MDGVAFRALIAASPLLADGGMGTALVDGGADAGACLERLNVDDPERVLSVHRGFVRAGSRLLLTNTFGASRFRLAVHGLADRVEELNREGVRLARAAGPELVGGSLGPLGVRLAPYGRVDADDARRAYAEQVSALAEAGADLLVIETQVDLREMEEAVGAARGSAPGLALIVSATFSRDDRTLLGSTPEQVAARLAGLGVDALGVNCGEGPEQALRVIRSMRAVAGDTPLVARPNAGGPAQVGGRLVYPATPDYLADHLVASVASGARLVGGCCGTGPAHLEATAAALARGPVEDGALGAGSAISVLGERRRSEARVAATATAPTGLQERLSRGESVVAVELEPPRSFAVGPSIAAAETLAAAGADVIDVADSPMAKMRMSAWAVCRLVHERVGVETVLHFPTRGRNLLRLQGDLLGAHALGIRNLFVCVGDPVTVGDYPQGSNNVDVTATGLLALVTEGFNAGRDRAGGSIGEPTSFFVGAAVAPGGPDLERECRLLARKVRAGARFLLSQPVYSATPLRRLRETYERVAGEPLAVPILAGVLPLMSARHAAFLHNEVPGIEIPGDAVQRLTAAAGDATRTGISMALELVDELHAEGVGGFYVMPQFGRYDLASEVVEAARRANG
jgi:homocysteine S-methyltransferase